MAMTPEELAALTSQLTEALLPKMAEIANAASTAQVKRLEKQLADAKPVPAPETEKPKVPDAVSAEIKADPKLAVLQAAIEEMTKRYNDADNARKAAEEKARNDSAYNTLRSNLTGVREGMQDIAAKVLFGVEKRVTFDENGQPLFKVQRTNALGSVEEQEMPLTDGVAYWLKTKEAAPYLPSPGTSPGSGVGGRPPTSIPSARSANGMPVYDSPATSEGEKIARANERAAALKKLLPGID